MAVSGAETFNTMSALFMETYAKQGVKDIMPDLCKIQKGSDFFGKDLDEAGLHYNQPVTTQYPQGWTFWPSGGGSADLNAPRAGKSQNAQVTANNMLLRDQIDYETAARAVKGKTAFVDATAHVIERMGESSRYELETNILYGQVGLGAVKAATAINTTITIADAEWAGGLFINMIGAAIDFWSTVSGGTYRGSATITNVDPDLQQITFDTDVSTFTSPVVAGDVLFRYGKKDPNTGAFREGAGIHAIVNNTGILYNINAALVPYWKASTQSANNDNATYFTVQNLLARASIKGAGKGATLYMNVFGWNNLAQTEVGYRRYDASYTKGKFVVGAEEIEFHGQTGVVKIVPHTMVKAGYAYLVSGKMDYRRIGATDWTFRMPGSDVYLRDLPDNAAYELRLFSNQVLFCECPGRSGKVNNIVN